MTQQSHCWAYILRKPELNPGIKRMGPNIDRMAGSGADSMERMGAGLGHGMDHVGSETECMVLGVYVSVCFLLEGGVYSPGRP